MYSYATFERVLSKIMLVRKADMPAFRARVRHLRNIGVARIPKPGRGQKVVYSEWHAFEMVVALQLSSLGCLPKVAARGAAIAKRACFSHGSDGYLVADPQEGFVTIKAPHVDQMVQKLPACALINFAVVQGYLDRAFASDQSGL